MTYPHPMDDKTGFEATDVEMGLTKGPEIITDFWAKPIPMRQFDWVAHYDDEEGYIGYGATEQEAINDLLTEHPPCKNESKYVRADGGCLRCDADQGEACRD